MSRTVHILQNSEFEGPGFIAEWAKKRKFETSLIRAYAGDAFPSPDEVELLVVLGAPMSATDPAPWLALEREFLLKTIPQETLTLGLCFGAQFLAHILGGKVGPSVYPERGWHEVKFASEALASPAATLFQWHNDDFTVPPGGRPLAKSRGVAVHGFQKGAVSALTSHLEITPDLVETFIEKLSALSDGGGARGNKAAAPGVQTAEEMRRDLAARCQASSLFAYDFLDLWAESTFQAETPIKITYR